MASSGQLGKPLDFSDLSSAGLHHILYSYLDREIVHFHHRNSNIIAVANLAKPLDFSDLSSAARLYPIL